MVSAPAVVHLGARHVKRCRSHGELSSLSTVAVLQTRDPLQRHRGRESQDGQAGAVSASPPAGGAPERTPAIIMPISSRELTLGSADPMIVPSYITRTRSHMVIISSRS